MSLGKQLEVASLASIAYQLGATEPLDWAFDTDSLAYFIFLKGLFDEDKALVKQTLEKNPELQQGVREYKLKRLLDNIELNYALISRDDPVCPQQQLDFGCCDIKEKPRFVSEHSNPEKLFAYVAEQLKTITHSQYSSGYIFLLGAFDIYQWIKVFDVNWLVFLRDLSERLGCFQFCFVLEQSDKYFTIVERAHTHEVYEGSLGGVLQSVNFSTTIDYIKNWIAGKSSFSFYLPDGPESRPGDTAYDVKSIEEIEGKLNLTLQDSEDTIELIFEGKTQYRDDYSGTLTLLGFHRLIYKSKGAVKKAYTDGTFCLSGYPFRPSEQS